MGSVAYALSDSDVIIVSRTQNTVAKDSSTIIHLTWGASVTANWGFQINTGAQSDSQSTKLAFNSDNTKLYHVTGSSTYDILIHTMNVADGSVVSKMKISGAFSGQVYIQDVKLVDTNTLVFTASESDRTTSLLFIVNPVAFTGKAYTGSAGEFDGGINGPFSDGHYWIGGEDNANKKYTINKLNFAVAMNRWWTNLYSEKSGITYAQITNTDFDPTSFTISPQAIQSSHGSTSAYTVTPTNEASVVSVHKALTLNNWSSATAKTIDGSTTGTFTPEYYCLAATGSVTSPSEVYSLVDGAGSVPSWVSIDSSTGVISYTAPAAASSESFSVRTVIDGDLIYNTPLALTVNFVAVTTPSSTPASTPAATPTTNTSSNTSTTESSDSDSCLGTDSKGK